MAEDTKLNEIVEDAETAEEMPSVPESGMSPMPPRGGHGPGGHGPGGHGGRGPQGGPRDEEAVEPELPEGCTMSTKTVTTEDGTEIEVPVMLDAEGNEVEMPEPPAMGDGPRGGRGPQGGPGRGRGPMGGPQGGRGFGGPMGGGGGRGAQPEDEAPSTQDDEAVSAGDAEEGVRA